MATLANEEVEMFAQNLMKAGILSLGDYNVMWSNERIGIRNGTSPPLTIQKVIEAVPQGGLSNSEMTLFDSLSEEVGATVVRGEHEALRAIMNRPRRGFFGDFKAGLGAIGDKIGDVAGPVFDVLGTGGTERTELGGEGNRQMVIDITRQLKEAGYADLPQTLFRNATTMDEIMDVIMEKTDITPDELAVVMTVVDEKLIAREQTDADVQDALDANEALDRKNEDNPLYAKNLAAFEILDRAAPTKYQFDEATGAIFRTDGLGQVDRSGNTIEIGDAMGADLVGGWDGQVPDFGRYEGGLADGLETGWEKMQRETGTAVDEFMYFDILDVVANKQHYGAEPSRYLPTAPRFLGDYASTYRVQPEQFQPGSRYGYGRAATEAFTDITGEMQPISLRPQYDVDDEWAQFVGQSPENIAQIQKIMVSFGALEEDEIISGVWGPTEAQQMYKVLDIANASGKAWETLDVDMVRASFDKETAATTMRAAFVPQAYRPMDPAEAEVTVKDSIRQMLGRDATDEDLSHLGGYLTDMHAASYEADTHAARNRYNTQVALDKSGGTSGTPAAVEDVNFEARYIQEMEKRFEPQLESQERAATATKQQNMGVKMSNLMSFVGGA